MDVLRGEKELLQVREIKYLKRMLDELKGRGGVELPCVFVIDEILKGTNTRERLWIQCSFINPFIL